MSITSRNVIALPSPSRIQQVVETHNPLDRASVLTVYQIELRVAIESERQRHKSLQHRAADICERACIREYGSPAATLDEDDTNLFLALSDFERATHFEMLTESGAHLRMQHQMERRLRRVDSLLATMQARRIA